MKFSQTSHFVVKAFEYLGPWETPACQPHICVWEDHGTRLSRSYAKAHEGQGGNSIQPVQLHQGSPA